MPRFTALGSFHHLYHVLLKIYITETLGVFCVSENVAKVKLPSVMTPIPVTSTMSDKQNQIPQSSGAISAETGEVETFQSTDCLQITPSIVEVGNDATVDVTNVAADITVGDREEKGPQLVSKQEASSSKLALKRQVTISDRSGQDEKSSTKLDHAYAVGKHSTVNFELSAPSASRFALMIMRGQCLEDNIAKCCTGPLYDHIVVNPVKVFISLDRSDELKPNNLSGKDLHVKRVVADRNAVSHTTLDETDATESSARTVFADKFLDVKTMDSILNAQAPVLPQQIVDFPNFLKTVKV